jgi:hypothetical protein
VSHQFLKNITPMLLISEEEKTNARKLSLVLCYVQRVTAAPVTVTYNDRGGKEKKKNHTVDIK